MRAAVVQCLELRRELMESQRRERTAIARLSIMPTEEPALEEGARERVGRVTSEYFKPLTTTEAQGNLQRLASCSTS